MDSVTNKTRLAEKRYKDKLKNDIKKETRLNNRKYMKQNKKIENLMKTLIFIIINYKKQKIQQSYGRKKQIKRNDICWNSTIL